LRPVGYLNLTKTKGKDLIYTSELLENINKQIEAAMSLGDGYFRVFGIRHKFNTDFSVKKNFSRCWVIPILPTFSADGNVYMCFDMRGRKNTIMCSHFPDVTEISKFWNSKEHKELVKNYDISSCPRCTLGPYNEMVEKVIIEDNMCINFP
jgi:radical SAM protein with 4Fe4S-binding SPASM domain